MSLIRPLRRKLQTQRCENRKEFHCQECVPILKIEFRVIEESISIFFPDFP